LHLYGDLISFFFFFFLFFVSELSIPLFKTTGDPVTSILANTAYHSDIYSDQLQLYTHRVMVSTISTTPTPVMPVAPVSTPAQKPPTHAPAAAPRERKPVNVNDGDDEDIESMDGSDAEDLEEEAVNPGYREWKRRRRDWTRDQGKITPQPSVIKNLSHPAILAVYQNLVVNRRKVRNAMSLEDVLVVLQAGWSEKK
jgi:hypothetical protein